MSIRLSSHIPIEVTVGEDTLKLAVKRLTFQEMVDLRARYREVQSKKEDEQDALWVPLLQSAFKAYVRIDSEIIVELADGEEKLRKTEGDLLLEYFGGQPAVMMQIFMSLLAQSSLSDKKKSTSSSDIDSLHTSEELPAITGPKPVTTATSAELEDSAKDEDVPEPVPARSGSTDRIKKIAEAARSSSSTNAPSFPSPRKRGR